MPDINIFEGLITIQKKHAVYFAYSKTTILDCVAINWLPPVQIIIIRDDIPEEILQDIREILLPANEEE